MANNKWNLFGFKIGKKDEKQEIVQPSFTPPSNEDGSYTVTSAAQFGTTALDLDGSSKNEVELITKYREASLQPELEAAIEDIVNEAIIHDEFGESVKLTMEKLRQSDKIKRAIEDEFKTVLRLLNFNNLGGDIFRRWYIDGRLFYHVIVDVDNPQKGIQELRYIDPRKIRKIREVKRQKDPNTGVDIITTAQEYFIYSDRIQNTPAMASVAGVKIAPDSIINVNSGLMDPKRNMVLSYLHKALKPLSQLRIIEDAAVIYRLCLVGDTRVKTNNGWKYIKDIEKSDIVYSYWGPEKGLVETPVVKQWKTGTKQTYTVSSKHFSITGTDNHPILVLDRTTNIVEYVDIKNIIPKKHCFVYEKPIEVCENIEFPKIRNKSVKLLNSNIWSNLQIPNKEKYIKQISTTFNIKNSSVRNFLYGIQYLNETDALQILDEVGLENYELDYKYEFLSKSADINLPEYIDEEFARLYGFMLGDGTIDKNRIVFAEGIYPEKNLYYANILTKYFGNCNLYKTRNRTYNNYTTNNTLGAELFKKLGFTNGAKIKRVPDWIWKCSNEIKKQFVLGFCDADGHIKNSIYTGVWSAEIELCNKQLVEDLKELWTSIGLFSGKLHYRKRDPETRVVNNVLQEFKTREAWWVRISDYELPKFEPIFTITEAEIEDVYELEVKSEKHNFIANGIVVHNSRAPERRIFYIDVGNLPRIKAEQYVRDIMTKYKNKLVYDASTGEVKSDSRHLSLLEDYWLPRRSDQRSTEIDTLPGAQNLDQIGDISYFEKKLYKSLGVPVTRLDPSQATSVGRATEITRDELKFSKFIDKLRAKFSELFDQALRIQLVLKGVCTEEEWKIFKENVFYDYIKDNNFIELKESELMQERLSVLAIIDQYAGKYYSKQWIKENILRLNDEDIIEMEKQIQEERATDFKQQEQDQEKQIQLQAQAVQLQNELMPQPDQQIDAGDDGSGQQQKKNNNPYLQ